MSLLDDVKSDLRIVGTESDAHLQSLIDEVTSECLATFDFPEGYEVLDSLHAKRGIRLLVQQDFEGDPAKREIILAQARALWRLDAVPGV